MHKHWFAAIATLFAHVAFASPHTFTYDQLGETKVFRAPLTADSPYTLDGRISNLTTGSIDNTFEFTAGSSALSMSAAWLIAPPSNRTVGVNIDLLDGSNNLVASDQFGGVVNGVASSTFSFNGLVAGARYSLQFTGAAIGAGRYAIDLMDGTTPPPIPILAPSAPDPTHATFDTHRGEKFLSNSFAVGDGLVIDGKVIDDGPGTSIDNLAKIIVTSDSLSAGIEWIVGTASDPLRTVGVNVDLIDPLNNVVASDTFMGVTNGQAFSQLVATGLTPGVYQLQFTGATPNGGGRYRIDLGGDALPPGFDPIVDAPPAGVPEPSTIGLLGIGMLVLVVRRRRSLVVDVSTAATA